MLHFTAGLFLNRNLANFRLIPASTGIHVFTLTTTYSKRIDLRTAYHTLGHYRTDYFKPAEEKKNIYIGFHSFTILSASIMFQDNQNPANNIAFSVFCGLLVTTSYHLSRSQSDPTVLARLITGALRRTEKSTTSNRPKRRSNAPAIDSSSAKQQENNGNGRSAEIIVAGDNDLRSGNAIITTAQPDEPGITVSAGGTINTTAGTSEGVATATEATEAWKHHEFVDPLPQQMRDTVVSNSWVGKQQKCM